MNVADTFAAERNSTERRVMPNLVRVSNHQHVNIIDLTLPSSLDSETFDELNQAMVAAVGGKASADWLIDLKLVEYMGSSMLGLMINIRQQIKTAGGELVLAGLSPRLRQIFHTCCLERLFSISEEREAGLKALGVK